MELKPGMIVYPKLDIDIDDEPEVIEDQAYVVIQPNGTNALRAVSLEPSKYPDNSNYVWSTDLGCASWHLTEREAIVAGIAESRKYANDLLAACDRWEAFVAPSVDTEDEVS